MNQHGMNKIINGGFHVWNRNPCTEITLVDAERWCSLESDISEEQYMDEEIIRLIEDTIVRFDEPQQLVIIYGIGDNCHISISGRVVTPSQFFNLLKKYKDKNQRLYNEIFEKRPEYLI